MTADVTVDTCVADIMHLDSIGMYTARMVTDPERAPDSLAKNVITDPN